MGDINVSHKDGMLDIELNRSNEKNALTFAMYRRWPRHFAGPAPNGPCAWCSSRPRATRSAPATTSEI
ncbi:MAG: hypothetical protein BGO98_24265 [Myxococcales bacterium 68-20]|nr:MAG: hypothetical protein BGO98_24265 [Myxococcales bacterium 68-20]